MNTVEMYVKVEKSHPSLSCRADDAELLCGYY